MSDEKVTPQKDKLEAALSCCLSALELLEKSAITVIDLQKMVNAHGWLLAIKENIENDLLESK